MSDEFDTKKETNDWGEPLFLPLSFVHPQSGRYKDKPESFFENTAVRVLSEVEVGGGMMLAPVWLDVLRFEDHVVDGQPVRLGIGRTQRRVHAADKSLPEGIAVPFCPTEVVDLIERLVAEKGDIYIPVASAA